MYGAAWKTVYSLLSTTECIHRKFLDLPEKASVPGSDGFSSIVFAWLGLRELTEGDEIGHGQGYLEPDRLLRVHVPPARDHRAVQPALRSVRLG